MRNLFISCSIAIVSIVVAYHLNNDEPQSHIQETTTQTIVSQSMLPAPIPDEKLQVNQPVKVNTPEVVADPQAIEPNIESYASQYQSIHNEMEKGDFSDVLNYHNIVTFCNSIPVSEDELSEWIYSHADQVDLNIPFMEKQMEQCEQVPRKSYNELQSKYRQAISQGEPLAKLALAMLIPFESEEKISLLSDSANRSQNAVDMLAQRSLTPNELLSDEQRVFWLSISSIESAYGEDFVFSIADAKAMITNTKLAKIEQLIEEWKTGDVYVRSEIRHKLTSEKSL